MVMLNEDCRKTAMKERPATPARGNSVLTASQSVPPLTAFATAVAFAVMFVVLPFGTYRATQARENAAGRADHQLAAIESKQQEALNMLVAMHTDLAQARSRITQLKVRTQQEEIRVSARERSEKTKLDRVQDAYLAATKQLDEKLQLLETETKTTFKDLKMQLDIRKNRFLVKWHGDSGVKTSKRMTTENDALNFFNQVGDYAKKLLMFDGQRWIVLREFGGENWLSLMHDDGETQDGDGKAPSKKKNDQKKG
jgi:hypothetical protein